MSKGKMRRRGSKKTTTALPIRGRNIALYILKNDAAQLATEIEPPLVSSVTQGTRLRSDARTIDNWRLQRVQLSDGSEAGEVPLDQLAQLLREMYDAVLPSGSTPPMYLIVHVADLIGLPQISESQLDASVAEVLVAVRTILDSFDSHKPGEPRGYYFQYDERKQRKGYLAVGSHAAILMGLSDDSFATLASLLQVGELAATGGFTPAGLNLANIRVSVWSAHQDTHEVTNYVAQLSRAGDRSTRGQIRISYTLAFIGIALAFLPLIDHPYILAPGMIALAMSGFAYSWYTEHDKSVIAAKMGPFLLAVGILLLVAAFALHILVKTNHLPFQLS